MLETRISGVLTGRSGTIAMIAIAIMATIVSYYLLGADVDLVDSAIFHLPASLWSENGIVSLVINMIAGIVIILLISIIEKQYSIVRTMSTLYAGIFLLMQAALPLVSAQFNNGTLLCIIVLPAIISLLSTYHNPQYTQRLYLAFLLLSSGALILNEALAYLIVALIIMMQMQSISLRGFLAAVFGVVTPWWILIGFGIINPIDIELPRLSWLHEVPNNATMIHSLATVGVTMFVGLCLGVANLIKIYSYNAQARSYNGALVVTSLATSLLIIADNGNFLTYTPLLNCLTAIQASHFFVINHNRRIYIAIVGFIAIYALLYAWALTL